MNDASLKWIFNVLILVEDLQTIVLKDAYTISC